MLVQRVSISQLLWKCNKRCWRILWTCLFSQHTRRCKWIDWAIGVRFPKKKRLHPFVPCSNRHWVTRHLRSGHWTLSIRRRNCRSVSNLCLLRMRCCLHSVESRNEKLRKNPVFRAQILGGNKLTGKNRECWELYRYSHYQVGMTVSHCLYFVYV